MVEPIQAEGGVNMPSPGYLRDLKALCRERDVLLIFDEVQVGMGRTGSLFAYEQEEVAPDIMTLAKALGNGLPVGAMLAGRSVAESFVPGTHATTFGGTPLVTAVALEVLKTISGPGFLDRVRSTGDYFAGRLRELQSRFGCIREVRGRGLILGLDLDRPAQHMVEKCLHRGIVINCTRDSVLRFVPPLVIGKDEIDRLIGVLDEVLAEEPA
jgi:acetylornithine aminotransferase